MKPEEMTNEQLLEVRDDVISSNASFCEGFGSVYTGKEADQCYLELLRRLNESDALRKENEELRKDKERIDFLDDGNYGIDPRNIPGVMMNGRRFHCLAGRGDWSSLRDAIDAARLAKESEASHE